MKRIWRPLSSVEIKKYEEINEDSFGTFTPTLFQSILIFIAQKSFFKRGQLRRLIAYLTYSIRKKPLDIYFRKCAFRLRYDHRNHIQDGLLVNPKYNFDDIEFLLKGSDENSNFVDNQTYGLGIITEDPIVNISYSNSWNNNSGDYWENCPG